MSTKEVFEYAILRFVPNIEREEFVNIGVLLYSRHLRFIGILTHLDTNKILALDKEADLELLQNYVTAFEKIANGKCSQEGIGNLEPHERFRWLTANRSTIIQASSIHTGITADAETTLNQLFNTYVL